MNLHALAGPMISAVNPMIPAAVLISAGQGTPADDGTVAPAYETPGAITASIAATVLTVTAITAGFLARGQTLADLTSDLLAGTTITAQLTGTPGGIGTYSINQPQTITSEAMTTSLEMTAQFQPLTWRDLQQLDGLTLSGTRRKVYLYGSIDSIERVAKKGGDLIVIDSGVNAGTWYIAQVLEQFPDWVSAAVTLQNGA